MLFDRLVESIIGKEFSKEQIDKVGELLKKKRRYLESFIEEYSFLVPEEKIQQLNKLNLDKVQYEDQVIDLISKYLNDVLIKHFKTTIGLDIDTDQLGDDYVYIRKHSLTPNKEELLPGGIFYHITKESNKEKILKQGLIPYSKRHMSLNYTPSIFLFKELPTEDKLIDFGRLIQGEPTTGMKGASSAYQGNLALFEVHLPSTYKVIKDPGSNYYYTNKAIPSRYIKFIKSL